MTKNVDISVVHKYKQYKYDIYSIYVLLLIYCKENVLNLTNMHNDKPDLPNGRPEQTSPKVLGPLNPILLTSSSL